MTLYADTSALARAYFGDEPEHGALRALLLESDEQVVTSELAHLELTSAVCGASRADRVSDRSSLLRRIDADCRKNGAISLLRLRPLQVLATARDLLLQHRLRTLDAIHLAVALEDAPAFAGRDEVVLVTRDADQAAAARAVGLAVR